MTSDGPWDATFIEDRHCVNYAPQDSLYVSGWGSLVACYWNGGAANHPPEVSVVSCRDIGTFRLPCGGPGSCDCTRRRARPISRARAPRRGDRDGSPLDSNQ